MFVLALLVYWKGISLGVAMRQDSVCDANSRVIREVTR